jgi:hypothetical protein
LARYWSSSGIAFARPACKCGLGFFGAQTGLAVLGLGGSSVESSGIPSGLGLNSVQDFLDPRQSGNSHHQPFAQQKADLVNQSQVAGVCEGDSESSVVHVFKREKVVSEHQLNRDALKKVWVQLEVAKIHEIATAATGQFLCSSNIASAGLIHVSENDASGGDCRKSVAF